MTGRDRTITASLPARDRRRRARPDPGRGGGALYGIVGVLIAVPVAATVHLLIPEIVFLRLVTVSDPAR
jgi:hypothetical protein